MLGHDFVDVPGCSVDIGDNPFETVMLLRCKWCNNTPSKSRADGCPIHELEQNGCIVLSAYNPDGMERFADRKCVTCDAPIMEHWLKRNRDVYFCDEYGVQESDGITDCVWDVADVSVMPEGLGKQA